MQNIVKRIRPEWIYEVMDKTPLEAAEQLSKRFANKIYFKREDTTPVHSFKLRGAYHKMRYLTKAQLKCGVITSSAGNHAQGVAFSAQKLGAQATIVMPKTTPYIKIEAVKNFGGKVILYGDDYEQSRQEAEKIAKQTQQIFIHPFDDVDIIAGQATIAIELLSQLAEIDYIFVPVGGGGLICGIGAYIKSQRPQIKIIGVEPTESCALTRSLQEKKRVTLNTVGLFAEGVAVQKIGVENFRLMQQVVDETILVSNDQMCAGIKDVYNQSRNIVEPSGALSVSGAKRYIEEKRLKNKNIICILSGANVNFDRLRHIAERAEIGEQKEALLAVTIDEKEGSFLNFCRLLDSYVITEFNYRYATEKAAHIFVGVRLNQGLIEKQALITKLKKSFEVLDMSDDSLAKTHIRYMIGGRAHCANEVIYRFEFPERPRALLDFLEKIGNNWNISLFHYRNHGVDFGRVLIGLQAKKVDELEQCFDKLGYFYQNETNNKAYQYFL